MKKYLSLLLVFVLMLSFVTSCDFLPDEIQFCDVNFYVDGELFATKTVMRGQTVSMPIHPAKENQLFLGWFIDSVIAYEFDFSSPVLINMDLHARYTPDAVTITNMLTTQTMRSVVTVLNKCYNTAVGGMIEMESLTSQGSGVIVDISGGYVFVLTNHHVVVGDSKFEKQSILVEDAWGNQFEASVYKNPYAPSEAMDKSYDLALLYFKYDNEIGSPMQEIEMANDPLPGEFVISLGAPNAQKNAITYGEVIDYQMLDGEGTDTSDVPFEIIYHSALIDHGSSGGPLLNAEGKLVGLNYAGFEINNYGCAIPVSKIIEFMDIYVYAK